MQTGVNMKDYMKHPWAGVFPATLCPFHPDESIDEQGLRGYIRDVISVEGIKGVVCNGHTGEIMSLRPHERANVTRIVADEVRRHGRGVKAITGVSAEGSAEAVDHAIEAAEAGAQAILLMPPHHWLRFARSARTAVGFVQDVAERSKIPIILHQYPAWTRAGYSLDEMLAIAAIPGVVSIKMGTRDMARARYDYERLKSASPDVTIITCHDEFLLASLLEGSDGALVGFAGFVPDLIVRLTHAALDGDLVAARNAQKLVDPLARIVYAFGEPGCEAHQRMKCARWLMGKFPSPLMRRPLRPLEPGHVRQIATKLRDIGIEVAPELVPAAA
jgi:4-hydroxy-tetrahydrodipicolinate synthase